MGKMLGGAVLAVAALAMSVTPAGWAAPAGPSGPGASGAPPGSGGAAVVARPAVPVVPARPVRPGQETEADDGLRSEANTSFVVDPGARVIRASTEMTLTHQYDPDYYFHGYDVPVLAESVNHRVVRSDGASLSVDVEPAPDPESGVAYALVSLRPNLFAGDSITFRLDYDLPFQAPRSPGWSRGNDAVVTFPAFTPGDPGLSRVEVRVPLDYEVEVGGAEPQRSEADGHHVLTEEAIPEPWMYTAVIVATRDDAMLEQEREVGDRTLRLRAWPDDAAWIDYVGGQLEAQMPVLEDLTGQSWPAERGELEVVESSAPGAHGYAGWFDHAENSIALGDAFDPATIAHELAHVWFNGELFTGRWINEAFADEYAESTLAELATPGFLPSGEPPPDPAGPGAVALNDWEDTWAFEDVDHVRERYAYLTSWYVLDQIADEIGPEGLRGVVAAAADREVTYGGDPEGESLTGNITWRVLLDLIENEGSTRADGLFRTFVANPEQRAEMDARAVARPAYAALVERGDGWTPPFELRRAMGVWDFDEVEGLIATADEVLAVRAEAEEVLAGLDVELQGLEQDYETARDIDDLVETADSTLEAARAYRDAAGHHDDVAGGPIAKLGLLFSGTDESLREAATDLREGHPGGALAAAERVDERLDAAVRNGLLRLAAAVLLVALLVALLVWGPVHRRRRRRAAEEAREREVRQMEDMFGAPSAPPRPPAVYPTAPPTSAHPPSVTSSPVTSPAGPGAGPVDPEMPTSPPVATGWSGVAVPPVTSDAGMPPAPPVAPPTGPAVTPPTAPSPPPSVAPPVPPAPGDG